MDEHKGIQFLLKAIEDTQNTIRFVDTKAGLVLVGLTILSTFIVKFAEFTWQLLQENITFILLIVILMAIFTILVLIIAALACFKAINPLSSPVRHIDYDGPSIKLPFYLWDIKPKPTFISDLLFEKPSSKLVHNIEELKSSYSNATDQEIVESLTIELAKLSYIREKKIFRVNKGITLFELGFIAWIATSVIFKLIGF